MWERINKVKDGTIILHLCSNGVNHKYGITIKNYKMIAFKGGLGSKENAHNFFSGLEIDNLISMKVFLD